MDWKKYLETIGMSAEEIGNMEKTWGADRCTKMFAEPVRQLQEAQREAATAKQAKEEFERFYNDEVLPKMSTTFQDAINARTRAQALEERFKAAKEYGFLSDMDGVVPGAPTGAGAGAGAGAGTPGSPTVDPATAAKLDPRYATADTLTKLSTEVPGMLGRLTKMSNEHFALFGSPLLDVDELIATAQQSKRNVLQVWEEKYKVSERRAQIAAEKQKAHDKQIADEAIRNYLSEHKMPFATPAQPSLASHFTPSNTEDARRPWKNAASRKQERMKAMLDAWGKSGQTAAA